MEGARGITGLWKFEALKIYIQLFLFDDLFNAKVAAKSQLMEQN